MSPVGWIIACLLRSLRLVRFRHGPECRAFVVIMILIYSASNSIAVNPGSLLGSKMVQEGFGVAGGDFGIGVDMLTRAGLSDEFAEANGRYYGNDAHQFAASHSDAVNPEKAQAVVRTNRSIGHGIW